MLRKLNHPGPWGSSRPLCFCAVSHGTRQTPRYPLWSASNHHTHVNSLQTTFPCKCNCSISSSRLCDLYLSGDDRQCSGTLRYLLGVIAAMSRLYTLFLLAIHTGKTWAHISSPTFPSFSETLNQTLHFSTRKFSQHTDSGSLQLNWLFFNLPNNYFSCFPH